uniref:Uncharacterized protein n=1 Tax=Steinernema glaseri TaxID=37863 RepID=A0A1I7XYE2_9BILA
MDRGMARGKREGHGPPGTSRDRGSRLKTLRGRRAGGDETLGTRIHGVTAADRRSETLCPVLGLMWFPSQERSCGSAPCPILIGLGFLGSRDRQSW